MKRRHEIHTDASSIGLAGILLQMEDDEMLHPVMYFSRQTTPAESAYASHELEVLAIVESLERFKSYVLGKAFTVVTDCAAVATTKASKALVPRIARWWLRIMEYDFQLVHRPGAQMAHVDALSRAPVEDARDAMVVTEQLMRVDVTADDWVATMQMQDPSLRRIIDVLNGHAKADDERQLQTDYVVRGCRLYRKVGDTLRWAVPNAVRWRVVKSAHDDRGHFGLEKTWFKRMRKYVQSYLDACVECAYNKRRGGGAEGQLHVTKTIAIPFRTVHIDHLGPFPRSSKGNQYVVAIVDSFSKYVVVKAVRTTDSRAVTVMLSELSRFFGQPTRIVSDRGTAYSSKCFAAYCDTHAIQHIQNAVRTPRANGQVERVNALIATYLRTSTEDEKKWDDALPKFQWVMNSHSNNTIG